MKNYNCGEDKIVECWDEKTYQGKGRMTKSQVLEMSALNKAIFDDIAATAW